jgi:hypothetical protein
VTSDDCRELHERLSDPWWREHRSSRMDWLRSVTGVEECIAGGLRESWTSEDWTMFYRYVLAANFHPSRSQTAVLCEALRLRSDEIAYEDVVTALDAIRDPDSVQCLREILSWEPDYDEARWIALKALSALAAIGTPEALSALRGALDDPSEVVRDAAAQALGAAGD